MTEDEVMSLGYDLALPCLCCGAYHGFSYDSPEANDIFNVFCPGGQCEDTYSARC